SFIKGMKLTGNTALTSKNRKIYPFDPEKGLALKVDNGDALYDTHTFQIIDEATGNEVFSGKPDATLALPDSGKYKLIMDGADQNPNNILEFGVQTIVTKEDLGNETWLINEVQKQTGHSAGRDLTWTDIDSIKTIDLGNHQYGGTLPKEIGIFTQLENLTLNGMKLTGKIPEELYGLTKLTKLDLADNQLEGEISKNIGTLTELTSLDLANNQLTGPLSDSVGNCTKLTKLDVSNNQLSEQLPKELAQLSVLTELHVNGNQFSGEIPNELCQLVNLTDLDLHDNQFTGTVPKDINNLYHLTNLNLSENLLTGILPELVLPNAKVHVEQTQVTMNQETPNLGGNVTYEPSFIKGMKLTGKAELTAENNVIYPFDPEKGLDLKVNEKDALSTSHTVQLYDASGKKIYEGAMDANVHIDLGKDTTKSYKVVLDGADQNPNNVW
ncbi:leucine-rich repeat domain-containing protein, partial [Enterococcus faecium]|nr:leucine-rich repeat domain-containing protein [Enterococcus faecium]